MFPKKGLLIAVPLLASWLFAELTVPGGVVRRLSGTPSDDPGVKVVEERRGNVIHIFVETTNCLDITVTLAAELRNLRASSPLPVTVETRGRNRVELVALESISAGQPVNYHFTYSWRYGSRGGQPDGTAYLLPFEAGVRHKLFQGYRGSFSHPAGSPNEYAHDWDLDEGSVVTAARDGIVVGVRQDSTAHGVGERFGNSSNYVFIRHADGTYAEYLHLKQNGVFVKPGAAVKAGQPLALSGNTGHTSRPHLHFAVFRTLDGNTRETLPVKFRTRDGTGQTLEEGKTY